METNKKNRYPKFKEYYKSLSRLDKMVLKRDIVEKCMVSKFSAARFLDGTAVIAPLYQKVISEIIGQNLFD